MKYFRQFDIDFLRHHTHEMFKFYGPLGCIVYNHCFLSKKYKTRIPIKL